MIIDNGDQIITISDQSKKIIFPYWINTLRSNYKSLYKKLSGKCYSCLSNNQDLKKELYEIEVIADHIFHYSITTKNDCLKNIAYDLGIVRHDLNLMLLDEVLSKFSFMSYHNIEKCKACLKRGY